MTALTRFPHHALKPLAALVVLALATVSAAAEAAPRWKFKEGDTQNYVLNRGVEGKLDLQGSLISFKMGMTFDISWKIKSVASDGTADIDQTIDRIQINASSPLGGDLAYDSQGDKKLAGPAAIQLGPLLEGMLGQTFTMKVSSTGRVNDIKLPEKLDAVFKKQSATQNRQAAFGIGGGFSERGIKELIERSVMPLPEKDEASWTQHFENPLPQMGSQMTDITLRFDGKEKLDGKDVEKVTAVSEMTFEAAEEAVADVEITEQAGTATFLFDPAAGRMIQSDGVQSFVMEVTGAREITQMVKETTTMREGKSPPPKAEPKEAAE